MPKSYWGLNNNKYFLPLWHCDGTNMLMFIPAQAVRTLRSKCTGIQTNLFKQIPAFTGVEMEHIKWR
jgi:hypothetical protein